MAVRFYPPPEHFSIYRFFFILVSFLLLFQNSKFDHLLI